VILCADALEHCVTLALECDVLIVDPPYSEHVHKSAVSCGTDGKRAVRKRDLGFGHLAPELRTAIAYAASCVKRWSCVFSDVESIHEWRDAVGSGAEYIRTVPWIRWSQAQLSGDRPCTGCEMVSVFHANLAGKPIKKHWNGPGSMTHLSRRCLRGADKHPTEKPLDLILDLVSWFSDPGETVLDLCAGAGTTAVACALLGRECIAVEIDPVWAEIATIREIARPILNRDLDRAREWCTTTADEARTVPAPKGKHDVRTYERAQRRLADVALVAAAL
jgi:site-specific DNA-methyltransferase (adenine-specific)